MFLLVGPILSINHLRKAFPLRWCCIDLLPLHCCISSFVLPMFDASFPAFLCSYFLTVLRLLLLHWFSLTVLPSLMIFDRPLWMLHCFSIFGLSCIAPLPLLPFHCFPCTVGLLHLHVCIAVTYPSLSACSCTSPVFCQVLNSHVLFGLGKIIKLTPLICNNNNNNNNKTSRIGANHGIRILPRYKWYYWPIDHDMNKIIQSHW